MSAFNAEQRQTAQRLVNSLDDYTEFCAREASRAYRETGVHGLLTWIESYEKSLGSSLQQLREVARGALDERIKELLKEKP